MNFNDLQNFDLLARVLLITPEFGGRNGPVLDQYRGQFFWQINDENCTDWDARYFFENGQLLPGSSALCKILLSENVKNYSKGTFPVGCQFGIREGSRFVAFGVIKESKVKGA
jgi:translation elongation factor EF-Tu-like GTPase